MTTANKITIVRIMLVPFFVTHVVYYMSTGHEIHRFLGILAFAVAAVSDGLDGYIARHYNQRSELGAILDPLADKLLLVAGVVLLSLRNHTYLDHIPIWFTVTIISRDAILLLGLIIIHFLSGKVVVKPRWTGKIATVLQMTVVLWSLLKWDSTWFFYWCVAAALLTAVSGVRYVLDGGRQLSANPASAASTGQNFL